MYPTENPTEDLIRAARERFNVAIEEKDVSTIRSMLASSYHIVTGRSAQSHGADEEARRWSQMFESDPSTFIAAQRAMFELMRIGVWLKNLGIGKALIPWRGSSSMFQACMPQNGSVLKMDRG